MTHDDEVYAEWLNTLGSGVADDPESDIGRDLHTMHDRAEVSHPCNCSTGAPGDYEGPAPDCPRHGDPAILGYDPQELL